MITKTATRNVESSFTGSTTKMGMDLDGKAFRILFDGIYSNKIATPIREYMTNALDAHVAAGNAHVPFDVDVPTALNPTFRIRDYGIGVDENGIEDMFTMFRSSKTKSNDAVGAFGLGSKSAFAYTDTFNVTAWLNGQKRVYLAVIGTDDIPTLTFVPELSGPTDEPNGLEVSVPVQPNDIGTFRREISAAICGFDVKPNLNVTDLPLITTKLDGDGWRVFVRNTAVLGEQFYIRQGCVLYPVQHRDTGLSHGALTYNYALVADVPIGSCEVAVSREALAFDTRTREAVVEAFETAHKGLVARLASDIANAPTMVDAIRARENAETIVYIRARSDDYVWKGKPIPAGLKFDCLARIETKGEYKAFNGLVNVHAGNQNMWVVDRGERAIRKRRRLTAFKRRHNGNVYVIENPTNRELKRIIDLLEIPRERVVSTVNLPDVFSNGGGSKVKATGVYDSKRNRIDNPPDEIEYWLPISDGRSRSESYELLPSADPLSAVHHFGTFADPLGISGSVHLLTPMGQKSYNVTNETRYDVVLKNALDAVKDEVMAVLFNSILASMASHAETYFELLTKLGLFKKDSQQAREIVKYNGYYLTQYLGHDTMQAVNKEVTDLVEKLQNKFPLCFGLQDTQAIDEYINQRKASL